MINNDDELQRAVQEFHRLRDAQPGSAEEKRREALEGAIKAYSEMHESEDKKAKPPRSLMDDLEELGKHDADVTGDFKHDKPH